jgi:hypothetical protein
MVCLALIIEQNRRSLQRLVKSLNSGEIRILGEYNLLVTLAIFDYTESVRRNPHRGPAGEDSRSRRFRCGQDLASARLAGN